MTEIHAFNAFHADAAPAPLAPAPPDPLDQDETMQPGWAVAKLMRARHSLRGVLHPLGFLCLPLLRETGHGVCVHVWGGSYPTEGLVTSSIHAHSWHLSSYVLFGQVGNRRFRTTSVPSEQATHRVYEILSTRGADQITKTAQFVRCTPDATQYAPAHVTYVLKGGEFHTTEIEETATAATVLVAFPVPGGSDRSLGPLDLPGGADTLTVRRRIASPTLTRRAIDHVLDRTACLPLPGGHRLHPIA